MGDKPGRTPERGIRRASYVTSNATGLKEREREANGKKVLIVGWAINITGLPIGP